MKANSLIVYNFAYIMLLGAGFPILRYMSLHFDVNNNNAVRFLSGAGVLLLIGMLRFRNQYGILFTDYRLAVRVLLLGVLMTLNMYFFMQGLAYTNAVTGSLFAILAMPLAIGLAAIFYPDERQKTKNSAFYFGSAIALCGSLYFVWQNVRTDSLVGAAFGLGALFLFIAISLQSIQSLLIKGLNNRVNAIVLSSLTALSAGIFNLLISLSTQKLAQLETVSSELLLGLVFAGIYGIITGMLMSFHIVQRQGIVTYNLLQLCVPFTAAVFAYLWLDERLNYTQAISGTVVVMGCLYALGLLKRDKKRPHFKE
ncbi:DMT family transporter [Caviibacterium pharyngocola]|uniref:EamA family transporter n=1 Tax=Caviibacterium pharyngocola TaxID=28159 RepID=A0A2M8RUY7_9PAST|nr:DMT family transporter [Caviibacterium pharyngocola]PJG82708.1 EamA family transporter [Caviibacterium pharyngocola]